MRTEPFVLNRTQQQQLLYRAYEVATRSPDPSTQVGALVLNTELAIIGEEYNHFPHKLAVTDKRLNDRFLKYKYTGHAEWHAIIAAQRKAGVFDFVEHTLLVCPWACCTECAKYIIETGVTHVLAHRQAHERTVKNSAWHHDIAEAHQQICEARIHLEMFDGLVGGPPVRFLGDLWNP